MRVVVSKAEIEHLQSCMTELKPLAPVSGQWGYSSTFCAAAVLFHELMERLVTDSGKFDLKRKLIEHNEMLLLKVKEELTTVIYFLAVLVNQLKDGTFDRHYEPMLSFDITLEGDDQVIIAPVTGFKRTGEEYRYET